MKLGIIMPPKPESFQQAKALGLDFVEFDCNPTSFFGVPVSELEAGKEELKAASESTGVEVGAVGRWASPVLGPDGEPDPDEWAQVKAVIDFGAYLGAKHYLCSVNYVQELSYYKNITAAIKILNEIVAYAKERGMETAIVNCMMGGNYIRTPEQWKLVLSEVPEGADVVAGAGHQVRPLPQLCPRRPERRLPGGGPGVGRPLQILPREGRYTEGRLSGARALGPPRLRHGSPGA